LFIPLQKIDQTQRLVFGRIDETPDRRGEVMDYASSAPLYRAWSESMQLASGGANFGNVRVMHQAVAAGMLTAIEFDDETKAIDICAHIVDDEVWQKIELGVFTGFSPGGRFVRKWQDGAFKRYTGQPEEISLVDRPCIPTATFTMIKADGVVEDVAFQINEAPINRFQPLPTASQAEADEMQKDIGGIGQLAQLIQSLRWFVACCSAEAAAEADGSPLPTRFKAWAVEGVALLKSYGDEETSEALDSLQAMIDALPHENLMQKIGARHSKSDLALVQATHDHATKLGADCDGLEKPADLSAMNKLAGDLSSAHTRLGTQNGEIATLKQRVAELEAMPLPPKGVLRVVDKARDLGTPSAAGDDPDPARALPPGNERATLEIRRAIVNQTKAR
jgi:hypothetical protein